MHTSCQTVTAVGAKAQGWDVGRSRGEGAAALVQGNHGAGDSQVLFHLIFRVSLDSSILPNFLLFIQLSTIYSYRKTHLST